MYKDFTVVSRPVSEHMLSLFGSVFITAGSSGEQVEDFPVPTVDEEGGHEWQLKDIVNWMEFLLESSESAQIACEE